MSENESNGTAVATSAQDLLRQWYLDNPTQGPSAARKQFPEVPAATVQHVRSKLIAEGKLTSLVKALPFSRKQRKAQRPKPKKIPPAAKLVMPALPIESPPPEPAAAPLTTEERLRCANQLLLDALRDSQQHSLLLQAKLQAMVSIL